MKSHCTYRYSTGTLLIKHYYYYFPAINAHAMYVTSMPLQLHISIMIICAIVASIPILPLLLLVLLQMPFPFPISMLLLLLNIFLIDQSSDALKREFPLRISSKQYYFWDKGVSTKAVTFWWWLCDFYAKKKSQNT